jgi:hypothetical protein
MPSLNAPNRYRSPEQDAVVAAPDALALPPRAIPWLVRARVLFGGMLNQFGWIWLAFSMIFVVVFIGGSGLKAVFFSFAPTETAPGTVLRVEETNSSENDYSIYAIHYIFRIDQREQDYYGVSYTTNPAAYSEGREVQVDYQTGTPANSRMQGARMSKFGLGVLFVLIFPLVGVFLLAGGLRLGIRGLRLLRMGTMAQGTLIRKESTSTRINEQMVYKLTFEFADRNGTRYQTSAKTHLTENLQDEDFERVLYDPANPHYAVLFDNLPGRPEVDALGRILPGSPLRSGLVMIFPALTLLITLLMFL